MLCDRKDGHIDRSLLVMKYIIDRFEGKYALCEDVNKKLTQIPKYKVPPEAKEGDCIYESDGILLLDKSGSLDRHERMKRKLDKLF